VYQKNKLPIKISEHFEEFMTIYMKHIHDTSNILIHRKLIRDSEKLIVLIHDNAAGLDQLYMEYKEEFDNGKKWFTM